MLNLLFIYTSFRTKKSQPTKSFCFFLPAILSKKKTLVKCQLPPSYRGHARSRSLPHGADHEHQGALRGNRGDGSKVREKCCDCILGSGVKDTSHIQWPNIVSSFCGDLAGSSKTHHALPLAPGPLYRHSLHRWSFSQLVTDDSSSHLASDRSPVRVLPWRSLWPTDDQPAKSVLKNTLLMLESF